MEFDRYQKHHKLYLLGIICLLSCLSLLFYSFYLLPFLLWKLNYSVPQLIISSIALLEDNYGFSNGQSRGIIGLILFTLILLTGLVSYYVSNSIDNEIYKSELALPDKETKIHSEEIQKDIKESATIGFEIIFLMILVVVGLFVLQWLL